MRPAVTPADSRLQGAVLQPTAPPASIVAIDPGPTESAAVRWDGNSILDACKVDNESLLMSIRDATEGTALVIEQVASYGMPVGAEVFETVYWSGRFAEAFPGPVDRMPRLKVKLHLCHDSRAKDGNVRQVLIDILGPPGTKKNPGPTFGISGDMWQALALAVTYWDQKVRIKL